MNWGMAWRRMAGLLILSALVALGTLGDTGTANKPKGKKKTEASAKAKPASTSAAPAKAAPSTPASSASSVAAPAKPKPQARAGAGASNRPAQERAFALIPATSGPPGLFTLETGELLPQRGFAWNVYVNKFHREPGSLHVLNVGWTVSVGLHDRVTAFFNFEPHRHIHVSRPNRLSFNTPIANPQFGTTIYRSLLPIVGTAPGYVEDFPFASGNQGGVGEVTLGARFALAQERLGNPLNVAVGYDFIIPTRTQLSDLLSNQVQRGTFQHGPTGALSKTWPNWLLTSFQGSYRITKNSEFGGVTAFEAADQFRFGAGFLVFPEKRWQLLNEYTGIVFVGESTPNTTFGPRDPIDGVWGMRFYLSPWDNIALDLGYRYMLNLYQHGDRNGFIAKLGMTYMGAPKEVPPPPNRVPVAACSAEKTSVYAGSDEAVRVNVRASDPDGDSLTYNWTATGGRIDGSGPEVRWNSAGVSQGQYTVTAQVDDGKGGTASCAVDIRVEPRPNRAPTLTCAADRTSVLSGERVRITAQGSDPDGDALRYSWQTNGGTIVGQGQAVQLDTSGLAPGRYTVTGRAEDGRSGAADCTINVGVETPPPPPQAAKLNECFFRAGSARVDNVCKRILDDVALRLQNDPRARVVIVGYADPKEARPDRLGGQRAENSRKYLGEKAIPAARVDVRAAGGQAGAGKQNQRIDVIWVPEGATY